MDKPTLSSGQPRPSSQLGLIAVAVLAISLGIYQWLELIQIRTGGAAPLCSISESINCATVWNSALADTIQNYTGIPLAGWGIAWAIIILILSIELALHMRKGNSSGDIVLALRIVTAVGACISLALLIYSIIIGVICPTCFLFYLFVAIATLIVFRLQKDATWQWRSALTQSIGLLLISFALLLYFGRHTPSLNSDLASIAALPANSSSKTSPGQDPLAKFLLSLSPQEQQLVSDARALYRTAPLIDRPVDGNRLISGTTLSPVHIIDWIDIRCPHCKHLEEALTEIRQTTPANSWSEEGRHFPLDSECNPNIARSDNTHVACLAAKVLICLGGSPKGRQVRATYFQKQRQLTVDRIWDIAAAGETQRHELESCVDSSETAAILQNDIDLAMQYHISGTPLVVINGRQAPGYPPFIYAMIIAGGNSNAEGFKILPPPRDQILDR